MLYEGKPPIYSPDLVFPSSNIILGEKIEIVTILYADYQTRYCWVKWDL